MLFVNGNLGQPSEGLLKFKVSTIGELVRFFYKWDGLDDIVILSSVNYSIGQTITHKFVAPSSYTGMNRVFLSSSDGVFSVFYADALGQVVINGATATLDGAAFPTGSVLPTDGQPHTFVLTLTVNVVADIWIGGHNTFGWRANFINFDFSVDDGSVYDLPIDDGPGATTIRNRGSGADGTPFNFEDGNWQSGL